tara:strand:- start:28 stop:447 length:420 start_codon:yes stop_codon:yes gene_type:complete
VTAELLPKNAFCIVLCALLVQKTIYARLKIERNLYNLTRSETMFRTVLFVSSLLLSALNASAQTVSEQEPREKQLTPGQPALTLPSVDAKLHQRQAFTVDNSQRMRVAPEKPDARRMPTAKQIIPSQLTEQANRNRSGS